MSSEKKTGKFLVSTEKTVVGELEIAGPQSSVVLRDDEVFAVGREPNLCITGSLYDQTKITLIGCIQTAAVSHAVMGDSARPHSVTFFPHFIAEGRAHFDPAKPAIREVSLTFDDAPSLFYDFDAFGSVLDPAPLINDIVNTNAEKLGRQIRTGPEPRIAYFSGQRLIVDTDTALGTVRAQHCPSWPLGGPRGVRIDNQIWLSIVPETPVTFDDAVNRVLSLLRFIAVAVGRSQNLPQFVVDVGTDDAPQRLEVHWSDFPQRLEERTRDWDTPQPADLPLDPIGQPNEFVTVLRTWLAADKERREARVRIHESMAFGNYYTVNRLVGSANAFDLLPESAVPKRVKLSPEIETAMKECRSMFRVLPESDERESLLRALARLGRAFLKQKVRYRAGLIISATKNRFPELDWVCDQAVECRNHFVHGSSFNFGLEHPSTNQSFLTDTLEFVFTASELIEAGWDINRFLNTPTSMSHPFGAYRVRYRDGLEALRVSAKKTGTQGADNT